MAASHPERVAGPGADSGTWLGRAGEPRVRVPRRRHRELSVARRELELRPELGGRRDSRDTAYRYTTCGTAPVWREEPSPARPCNGSGTTACTLHHVKLSGGSPFRIL